MKKISEYVDRLRSNNEELNKIISPNSVYAFNIYKTHKTLDLIDKKKIEMINKFGNECGKARVLSLSCNGALAWLNVPWNMYCSTRYDDKKFFT